MPFIVRGLWERERARIPLYCGDCERSCHALSLASDLGGFALLPLAAGLLTLQSDRPGGTLLIVGESVVTTALLNQAVKFGVGRSRPYARNGNDAGVDPKKGDDHLSFFSGHTAVSFSLATATWGWMHAEGSPHAPWAGGALLAGAAFVGYSRIAADRHYLTDVLTGAVIGSAVGWLTVKMHRAPAGGTSEVPAGVALTWRL